MVVRRRTGGEIEHDERAVAPGIHEDTPAIDRRGAAQIPGPDPVERPDGRGGDRRIGIGDVGVGGVMPALGPVSGKRRRPEHREDEKNEGSEQPFHAITLEQPPVARRVPDGLDD